MTVDGNDAEAMFEATRAARELALEGGGPTLIEAVTMRMHGHAAHDDMKYVPKAQVEEWRARDPIDRQDARLRALGVDVDALRAEITAEIAAATEEALASPMPDPSDRDDRRLLRGRARAARRRSRALERLHARTGRAADGGAHLPSGDLKRAPRRAS